MVPQLDSEPGLETGSQDSQKDRALFVLACLRMAAEQDMEAHKPVVEIVDSPNSVVEVGVEGKNSWAGVEVEVAVDVKEEAFFPEKLVI